MNGAAQISDAFAVNDADLKNIALLAGRQIIQHQFLYFARFERVQVQHAINWKLDGFIHIPKLLRFS